MILSWEVGALAAAIIANGRRKRSHRPRSNEPFFDRRGRFNEELYFAKRDIAGRAVRLYRRPPSKPSKEKKHWHGADWIFHYNGFGQLIRKERVES